jgi:hypothetical protein
MTWGGGGDGDFRRVVPISRVPIPRKHNYIIINSKLTLMHHHPGSPRIAHRNTFCLIFH